MFDHGSRRCERIRGSDDLIPGADAQQPERHLHGGRGGVHTDGMRRTAVFRDLFFKRGRPGAGGDPAGTEHLDDLFNLLFGKIRR